MSGSSRVYAISIDAIKTKLIERIDQLVPELFPNAVRAGHEWVMGDIQGSPGRSLSIHRTGHKAGWFKDFADDRVKGDILTLFAAGACHGEISAAPREAIRWLRLEHLDDAQRREIERKAERTRASRAAAREADVERKRRIARGHWISASPILGTPAERYLLEERGIDVTRIPGTRSGRTGPGSLRFKPMRCPETSQEGAPVMRPCLLACVNHPITGEMLAVHRTFLLVHADGRVTKADRKSGGPMEDAKRALGDYAGGFIPLARGASGRPIAQAPAGEILVLSEGIEDGLSVALAEPSLRVGAALSLSNLGGIVPPSSIAGLGIAGQNDAKEEPRRALAAARRRLADRGIQHRLVLPPAEHKDWNDWLRALGAPARQAPVDPAPAEAVA